MDYILCNFWNFFPFSKKHGLSYPFTLIYFPSSKTLTFICNLWNFFPFSKNVDYHLKFLEFLSLKKLGLLYAISGISFQKFRPFYASYVISFPSPKTWIILSNF